MTRKVRNIILIHLIVWIVLSIIFFLLSERIIKAILPGVHEVGHWLQLLSFGLTALFVLHFISCVIFILATRKK